MTQPHLNEQNPLLDQLRKVIAAKNFSLPTLPESALKLRKVLEDPNVNTSSITRLLGTDPVLVGRLLQTANSPMFRGLRKISDLDSAVTRLGLSCIQNMVMSLTVSALFRDSKQQWIRNKLLSIWNDGIKIAALSQVIAKREPSLDHSEALLLGLLHDIGSVPIVQICAKKIGEPDQPELLDDAILQLSPNLSNWILQNWSLEPRLYKVPLKLADLYRDFQGPADYTDVIQVARLHVYRNKAHPLGKIAWNEVPAFKRLNLTPDASMEIIKEAREEIRAVIEILK